jgi:pimeloyl-ACP methyl ester carboxylesterase
VATFVEIQGEPLALEIYEPTHHLADVVLIHGFTGSKEDFNLIGPLLADQGYRVITFDNRGQHESTHSKRADAYIAESLARDVIELRRKLDLKKPHLFGHSFGGLIAQRTLVDSPHDWASLTIFCSGPGAIPNKPDLPVTIGILESMSMQESWDTYKEATDRLLPRYELYKKRWTSSDPRSTKTMAHYLLAAKPLISEIVASKVPVHVIYGENDDAWPLAMQDQMAAELHAQLTIISGAGHCPNEDKPEETAAVLANFWRAL